AEQTDEAAEATEASLEKEAGEEKLPPTPEEEIAQLKEKLLRLQAEFDNSRKRLERDKSEMIRYANESMLEDLLPVIDNFHLGLQAAEQGHDAKAIVMGMNMVQKQLEQFLSEHGVEEVNAEGAEFDHNLHEAVKQEPSDTHQEGQVISQQRKGYKLRDRLLRPALVIVASKS
ncbi:MAG: nucleotide exchange factor GrpE, partial [Verrucomicrobiota bacterium]